MSHSTHVGFSEPPACITPIAGSVSCPRRWPALLLPFQSDAQGVGQCSRKCEFSFPRIAWIRSPRPPCSPSVERTVGHMPRAFAAFLLLLPPPNPVVRGVGQSFTCALSFGSPQLLIFPADRSIASSATGVCQNPNSLSLVRCPGIVCAQHSPSRIIPQRGQVAKHSVEASNSKHWRVFHEDESGSYFANDSGKFSPESGAFAVDSCALSGCADVLAREAARDDIHQATPRLAVEGSHVVPDREGFEAAVILAGDEHAPGVGLNFDGADGSPPEEFAPEYAASSACEKCQLIHVVLFGNYEV